MKALGKRTAKGRPARVDGAVDVGDPSPPPSAPPPADEQAEPKRHRGGQAGNGNALKSGLHRATRGPRLRTPVNPDAFDAEGRKRAAEVYAGLGPDWKPTRRSYAEDYAAELRIERRGKVRGFFTPAGDAKDLLRILLDLKKRRQDREREALAAKLGGSGSAPGGVDVYVLLPGGLSLDDAAVGAPLGRPGANGEQDVPVVAPAHTFDGGAPGASQEAE